MEKNEHARRKRFRWSILSMCILTAFCACLFKWVDSYLAPIRADNRVMEKLVTDYEETQYQRRTGDLPRLLRGLVNDKDDGTVAEVQIYGQLDAPAPQLRDIVLSLEKLADVVVFGLHNGIVCEESIRKLVKIESLSEIRLTNCIVTEELALLLIEQRQGHVEIDFGEDPIGWRTIAKIEAGEFNGLVEYDHASDFAIDSSEELAELAEFEITHGNIEKLALVQGTLEDVAKAKESFPDLKILRVLFQAHDIDQERLNAILPPINEKFRQ